ncbi:MAG: VWA domain-containing protein [Candidatus Dormibacteria bacterium]
MSFLAPLGALALVGIPAILVLYFLKVRRPESDFSSTLLWRRAVLDRQASAPWQRLRVSRLLLLQLLAVALLAAALARPALAVRGGLGGHTILIVDSSATMQATDVAPSRFGEARRLAGEVIDKTGPGQRVTLIDMGPQARLAASATGDMGSVRGALAAMRPTNGPADLQQALALAASTAGAAGRTQVILLGDGITRPLPAATSLPFPLEYRRVGVSGENLALTSITLHPEPAQRTAVVRVENMGRQHRHADIEWHVDGRLVDARSEDIEAGAARDVSFHVPPGANRVWARLRTQDTLALDDVAYAVAALPRTLRVTVVSPANIFLQRALELRPDLRVTMVRPADYHFDSAVDLYVFDGIVPSPLPATPTWYLNPPAGGFGAGPLVPVGRPRAAAADDPLMRDVDLREVHVARSADLRHNTFGGRTLVEADSGPLVLVRDEPSRAVLFGFDLHSSDLPLRTAFPVLVDHLSGDLVPATVGARAYHPGEPVLLPIPTGTTRTDVTRPDGHVDHLAGTAGAGYAAFDDTEQTGFYAVEQRGQSGVVSSTLAVNGGGVTSTITPRDRVELVSSRSGGAVAAATPGLREFWPWLVAAVLLVLTLEWLVFHRGG